MDPHFQKTYATAIFKGKLIFAAEAWGGASQSLVTKVQSIQDRVTKVLVGPKDAKLSSRQRETKLGWISVKDEIKLATLRMTHKIAHLAVPEELAVKMPLNLNHRRLQVAHKLDTKPRELNKNKRTRDSYRNRSLHL